MKNKTITAVILDWAGTTVDYGCFAPVDAFMTAFRDFGIEPAREETRAPMGLAKRAHIEQMLGGARISALWREKHGRDFTQEDVDAVYARFEPALFKVLADHADPLPGCLETAAALREAGIKTGSTTGYTRAMMDVVMPEAKKRGYEPDCVVCPDDVGGTGRPAPYMLWRNLEKLHIASIEEVLKVGDTASDMQEARNAGCLAVGVLTGSSMVGLSRYELTAKTGVEREETFAAARRKYKEAGADFVIEDITKLPRLIEDITEGRA
ncbi:MAG: phosphonoacetaldehyde hydrolase [Clostridiales Family XIII bacterium]|jgi:phosphonoacetaldehyde hydrolase|nr:phosphonoacetaldehyde hydrolase [Clostridiales Family XIII bacterium]